MKQKNCFWAVAATMLLTAASFTSCSNQDNIVYDPSSQPVVPDAFDEGSLIKNGRCEGTETANFVVKEWRNGAEYIGAPTIKWDEETPRNHAIVVEVRSLVEAQHDGNPTMDGNNLAAHDTQFFITVPEELNFEAKDKIRLTMKVKADEPATGWGGSVQTQCHAAPTAYIQWYCVGNVEFTQSWTEFDSGEIEIKPDMVENKDNGNKLFHTIAFNLSKGIHNRYFFDDIRLEVIRHDKWFDDNILTNGRIEEEGEGQMKSFTVQEWLNGEKITASPTITGNARRVVDPLDKKNHCIEVISRDPAGASIDAWDSQFFITMPEAVKQGDKFKLEMRVRAEKAAKATTQAHTAPTAYKHWAFVGDVNFTTEWATFEKEVTVDGNQDGCNTIAFNLAELKEANKYYFDDIKIKIIEKAKPVENWETLCEYKGDNAANFGVKYFKNYLAATSADGAIVVESLDPDQTYAQYDNAGAEAKVANNHDVQFLIGIPQVLNTGVKLRVTMEVKADKEAKAETQEHGEIPAAGAIEGKDGYTGSYIHYALMGEVPFTTAWAKYESGEFSVPADGMKSICLNLEVLRAFNKYYFKNIKVEIAK